MVDSAVMLPGYRIPPALLMGMALDLLKGQTRSFSQDARTCTRAIVPPVRYIGQDTLPSLPCVITINHFTRPGFQAWWLALAVSAAVPGEVHWLITAAWTFPGRLWARPAEWISRRLLSRLAQIYAFSSMPPMPPRPQEIQARAQAVRRLLEAVRTQQIGWLGIAPEGRDAPGGVLQEPPQGSGRLLLLLAGQGLPILPVGIYEGSDALTVRFGTAYDLQIAPGLSSQARDREASRIVMQHLAKLLPESLRGPYGDSQIETEPFRQG